MMRSLAICVCLACCGFPLMAADPAPVPKSPGHAGVLANAVLSARIDSLVLDRLAEEKIPVSSRASDAEFLRRVYLDLAGRIPTATEAKTFLDSTDTARRAQLVDTLLAGQDHARHMADIWQTLLLARNSDARRLQREPFVLWLGEQFQANKPYNTLVREILTAEGPQDKNPATTFWLSQVTVDHMTDTVGKVFMGTQLQCAQCHNHPFTGWKQDEYWGMAAFFLKVQPRLPRGKDMSTPEVKESPRVQKARKNLPESVKFVEPKFFGGARPKVKETAPLRPVLADWLCASDNPFLARATVNRLWAQMYGRGLVHPVDNINDTNPASHPELLEELTTQFQANGFDLRAILRAMALSETYQRSSKPIPGNADALAEAYARMPIKVLSPEQLFDSLVTVLGQPGQGAAAARKMMVTKMAGQNGPRAQFLAMFEGDVDADATEYQAGIPQVLNLMNSPRMNTPAAAVRLSQGLSSEEAVRHLYLATLSRPPLAAETTLALNHLRSAEAPRQALADIRWALLNSTAFASNH